MQQIPFQYRLSWNMCKGRCPISCCLYFMAIKCLFHVLHGVCHNRTPLIQAHSFNAQYYVVCYLIFLYIIVFHYPFSTTSSVLPVSFVNPVFMQPLIEFALEEKRWRIIFFICQVERNFKLIITAFCVIWHFSHCEKEASLFLQNGGFSKIMEAS